MLEFLGFLFGLVYVITAGKQWRISWLYGLASVIIYIYVFYANHLYSDLVLQCFYVVASIYGFLMWQQKDLEPTPMGSVAQFLFVLEGIFFSVLLYYLNFNFPEWFPDLFNRPSYPIIDSIISGFSIVATRLIAYKKTQVWIWWMAIDLSGAALYIAKALWLTALLNIAYAGFAFGNYRRWRLSALAE